MPLFSGLSKRQLKDIARITDTVHFDAGYDIVVEDSPANFCCILVEGSVEVIKGGRRIAQMGPGELFGEMAVIDSGPRSATVRSLTEVLTIQIPRRAFADVASSDPRIQMRMLEVLARRLRNASKEIH
ncbi:MAG: cyclic nucleotide-binding domain-containing protein [Acidimicrobiia bacterium]